MTITSETKSRTKSETKSETGLRIVYRSVSDLASYFLRFFYILLADDLHNTFTLVDEGGMIIRKFLRDGENHVDGT
ncbi:hypothetical protein EFP86_01535 [Lentilactobacillus hilgardii]|nr:hypothetical protein [Lentilactobacillus hilgardii]